eukprot:512256-Prymnesium_polylepis.2
MHVNGMRGVPRRGNAHRGQLAEGGRVAVAVLGVVDHNHARRQLLACEPRSSKPGVETASGRQQIRFECPLCVGRRARRVAHAEWLTRRAYRGAWQAAQWSARPTPCRRHTPAPSSAASRT